jgi:tRNA dimethylallyltransferase
LKPALLFLIGPTASGKSDLAFQLAQALGAEIISADSMLVYRGMDIGTAKPSREDREKIPHHMIDIAEPTADFSVFDYRTKVLELLALPESQGKTFVVVGGSGLYVKALLHGISEKPGADLEVRKKYEAIADEKGVDVLKAQLQTVDPVYAGIVADKRRIVRALEVYELTGKTLTEWDKDTRGLLDEDFKIKVFGLAWDKNVLRERVTLRTRAMLAAGLIEEVRDLDFGSWSKTARQAIGYRETISYLTHEILGRELEELIAQNTLGLVKRQMTWFRKERAIQWLELKTAADLEKVREEILKNWNVNG